jgi:8-oxo-dGTP diphosphatase
MEYVAGFLFDDSGDRVALIHKQRPDWQKGRLNGVGGKIEHHLTDDGYRIPEWPADAMRRECLEEFGIDVPDWTQFNTLDTNGATVHFFMARSSDKIEELLKLMLRTKYSRDQEYPAVLRTIDVQFSKTVIPNLKWLIPMALEVGQQLQSPCIYTTQEIPIRS